MSKYSETILTANGLDLATRAANGKVNFSLTRAAATSDDLTKLDLQNLTKLPNEKQSGTITNQDENIPNSQAVIGTEILFTNEGIDEGYSINAVGLYAKEEGKDEEILYAVNTAVEPEFMPNFADKVLLQFVITMYVIVGRTENVTVVVDPTGMASKEYVETRIGQIDVNDKIQVSSIDNQLQKRLAYTEFKSKGSNKATQIAEMVGQLPIGLKKVDKEGNITPILPGDDGLINVGDIGGGTSVDGDKDHPSAGIDYYAGSLENGEITERHIASQTPTSPTLKTNVKFLFDVGTTMNRVGTGLQFMIYLQRTTITKGVIGAVTKVSFNYDPKNISKPGYYTTVAPVPMYTRAESYEAGKPNTITLEGVGEDLGLANHKAPGVTLTFNSDKTMDVEPIQGYDNDAADGGVTGYTYDLVVETIASYNVQTAVTQLPEGVSVFNGNAGGEIALTAVNDYFTNIYGLNVITDGKLYITGVDGGAWTTPIRPFNIPTEFKIPRKNLIEGYMFPIVHDDELNHDPGSITWTLTTISWSNYTTSVWIGDTPFIKVNSNSISIMLNLRILGLSSQKNINAFGTIKVKSVTIWKDDE